MTTAAFTPLKRLSPEERVRAFNKFLFLPVGHFNMLTVLLAEIIGLASLGAGLVAEYNSPQQGLAVLGGLALMLGTAMYAFYGRDKIVSSTEVDRYPLAAAGVSRPIRFIKKHPERVAAYHRLAEEMGVDPHQFDIPAALKSGGELLLTGKLSGDDIHLIVAAIRTGAVSTEHIQESVEFLRQNGVIPLLDGYL